MAKDEVLTKIRRFIPVSCGHVNISLGHLSDNLKLYGVNMDPDYQRGYVWTLDQKRKLVGALLEDNKRIPALCFNHTSHKDCDVLDGKQRLNACLEWLDGKIDAECPCGVRLRYEDLGEIDRRCVNMSVTLSWNFYRLDRKEVLRFYLALNSGGTVHSKEDLDRVKAMLVS